MYLEEFEVIDAGDFIYKTILDEEQIGQYLVFVYKGGTYSIKTKPEFCGSRDRWGIFSGYSSDYGTVCKELFKDFFGDNHYKRIGNLELSFDVWPRTSCVSFSWFFYRLPLLAKYFCLAFGGLKKILFGLSCFNNGCNWDDWEDKKMVYVYDGRFPFYDIDEDGIFDYLLSPFAVLLNDGSVFCYDASELSSGLESNDYLAYCLKNFTQGFEDNFENINIIIDNPYFHDQLGLHLWDGYLNSQCSGVELWLECGRESCVVENESFVKNNFDEIINPSLHYIFDNGKFFLDLEQFEAYSKESAWGKWLDRSYRFFGSMGFGGAFIFSD